MTALMLLGVSVCVGLTAVAVYDLQVRLERWDYERHVND